MIAHTDAHHAVFEPKNMTLYELQTNTIRAIKEFYSVWQITKRAARLDLFNVSLKAYGRNLVHKWAKKNQYFVDYTKALTSAGRTIELAAKKTAEDIKEQYHKLEVSGALPQPKAN